MLTGVATLLSIVAALFAPATSAKANESAIDLVVKVMVDDPDKDPQPQVEKGLGNGGDAADTITMLIEVMEKIAADAAANQSQGGASDPPGASWIAPTDPMAGLGQVQDEEYCGWASLPTPLAASDPAWQGNTSADGEVMWKSCAILGAGTPGAPGNLEGRPVEYLFFPNAALAAAAVPPPPDPQVIAQRAIRQLQVPPPRISAGPDRGKLAVNLWTWLWIDNPGPLTATAAAGGVSVTATATLDSVTWTLGEPAATGGAYAPGPAVTITCQGTGSAPSANYDWKAQPPCGHKYTWMSTQDRTGGTGTWPITATTNWNVTWQSNTGVTGATTLTSTGNDALQIGEYRIVLVEGAGG